MRIDALTRKAQVVLLRVVQDKRYRPVGSSCEQQADVRIVVATNSPLELLVRAGTFRADLYYRLCVFAIGLPALRERPEDIPLLADHFLQKNLPVDRPALRLGDSARAALLAHDWPGNVRELENTMIRGGQLCRGEVIEAADLGLALPPSAAPEIEHRLAAQLQPFNALKRKVIENFERTYLTRLIAEHGGNVSRAARAAGKERRELGKLLKKHRIEPSQFPAQASGAAV
jgi:DNA-binding NtrC family response regulator